MSDIKLPELPESLCFMGPFVKDQFFEYARQAVELNLHETKHQLAALTEDYKDLEAQLMAVGAGGVSKLIGDSE